MSNPYGIGYKGSKSSKSSKSINSCRIQTISSPTINKRYIFSPPNISATSKNRLQYKKFKPFAPNTPAISQSGVRMVLNNKKKSIQNEYYNT